MFYNVDLSLPHKLIGLYFLQWSVNTLVGYESFFIIIIEWKYTKSTYRQVSNISRTKSQHLKDSRTVLQLSLPNPLKPDVKSRMKM